MRCAMGRWGGLGEQQGALWEEEKTHGGVDGTWDAPPLASLESDECWESSSSDLDVRGDSGGDARLRRRVK